MNKLFMMIGIPASGKTSLAEQIAKLEDAEIVSSDSIRKELYGDENIQGDNNKVFRILQDRIVKGLKSNKNMIYDATNISYKTRMAFLQRIRKLEVEKIAIMVATPYEQCLIRNSQRERLVPEEVIKRMYYNFYVPQYFEGWDNIKIYSNPLEWHETVQDFYSLETLFSYMNIPHDNPHHKLSIMEHCKKVQELLGKDERVHKYYFGNVGLLHDIGKPFVKSFFNSKGEQTEIAHYYNHEKVSAYISILPIDGIKCFSTDDLIQRAKLIQWHMLPWTKMSEKTEQKYKKLLGENFWNDLMILHKADEEAH